MGLWDLVRVNYKLLEELTYLKINNMPIIREVHMPDWNLHRNRRESRKKFWRELAKNESWRLAGNVLCSYASKVLNNQWILLVLISCLLGYIWCMTWPITYFPVAENVAVMSVWVFRSMCQSCFSHLLSICKHGVLKESGLSWQSGGILEG